MTRCEAFYRRVRELLETENFDALEHFCKKEARQTLFRIRKYIEFCDEHMLPIGTVSECALRPLIQEGDPDIAVKVTETIKSLVSKKEKITVEVVKKSLAEVKGGVYLTPTERKQLGGETSLKQTEAACDEFLSMESDEQQTLLKDLRAIVDLLGTWGARTGPNLRAKISPVRDQVNALRNEFLLFLPTDKIEIKEN